jgi:thiol-disulfide isomerase/thioredoxin
MAGKSKTRKNNSKGTLTVDSIKKIPALEKALKSGKINIVLVFAEWCGACHKFRKNIWEPMLKKNAIHNRVAIRDDMVANTSLSNAKFDYLPSILVVDEKGKLQDFALPDGQATNAMPTPKSVDDMTRVVNVNVKPENSLRVTNQPQAPPPEYLDISTNNNADMEIVKTTPTMTPAGIVYKPTPLVAPPPRDQRDQKGGALLHTLEQAARGMLPSLKKKTRKGKKVGVARR